MRLRLCWVAKEEGRGGGESKAPTIEEDFGVNVNSDPR